MPPREALTRETLEREPLALIPETARPDSAAVVEHLRGISLLRASAGARLGLVAAAVSLLWLAVYWALA